MSAFCALAVYGRQDEWADKLHETRFDPGRTFLRSERYQRGYEPLDAKVETYPVPYNPLLLRIEFTLERSCDLFRCVDVYLPRVGGSSSRLNDVLYAIEVIVGGQRIDKVWATEDCAGWLADRGIGGLETRLDTNARIFSARCPRLVRHDESTIVVPLHLAPFHDLFPLVALGHHEVRITLEVDPRALPAERCGDVKLYAERFFVDVPVRRSLRQTALEFVTHQNAGLHVALRDAPAVTRRGVNEFHLTMNHPVHCMYFWGFDKSKVTRVRLASKDDALVFYDGPLLPLERHKETRGIPSSSPAFVFFSDAETGPGTGRRPRSTVNFSRLDRPVLTIETEEEGEHPFHLAAINVQGCRCMSGMMGLVFSK